MWMYISEMEVLMDVLCFFCGMIYKNVIFGLNLGGGKVVIIGDLCIMKLEVLFCCFGKFVNFLGGKYIIVEDVGILLVDMMYVNMEIDFVVGFLGKSGDFLLVIVYGVYVGMKVCVKVQFGFDLFVGKKVVVQGVGYVGEYLVKSFFKEGVQVFIMDIYDEMLCCVVIEYNVIVVGLNEIYDIDMDIYVLCVLGVMVNDEMFLCLKCLIIVGVVNNQLVNEKLYGEVVLNKGIIYVFDFVLNVGGVINCYFEVESFLGSWVM